MKKTGWLPFILFFPRKAVNGKLIIGQVLKKVVYKDPWSDGWTSSGGGYYYSIYRKRKKGNYVSKKFSKIDISSLLMLGTVLMILTSITAVNYYVFFLMEK